MNIQTPPPPPEFAAEYVVTDLPNGVRLHVWGRGETAKYAVGTGPIEYITLEEFSRIMGAQCQPK